MSRLHRTLIVIALAALVAGGLTFAAKGTDYGDGLSGRTTVPVGKLLAAPEPYLDEVIRVKGVVTDVCEKAGCWMTLVTKRSDELRVKVADGVIVFPLSARGKKAIAEGRLTKIEMTLEQTIGWERHLAEERDEPFDPSTVVEPRSFYQLNATGARIF